ncbi:MAG TPA: ABC transporter permease [Verrucomicrobiae bacterium]|jgi:peptide/nickel transport system permease protein|nr:ABC transporter permease [Verrucomicrobiae bacterium]
MSAISVDRNVRRRPLPAPLIAGIVILGLFVLMAAVPGWIAPYDPLAFDMTAILKPPSIAHPFGTDNFGRDILSRVIWAARIDFAIALLTTVFPVIGGTIIGALVGYYGGWLDMVFGRIVDLVVTFPFLVIVIAIVAVLGPGLANMFIAVSAVGWVFYARLMRAEVMTQKQADYAAAGRVLGYGELRIIFRHLLPNAIGSIIVYWMTDMALGILLGSSLGYLGLGAQPPTAEWGVLIAEGKNFISTGWWISVFPGIAIVVTGLGFSLVGDGVADLLRRSR